MVDEDGIKAVTPDTFVGFELVTDISCELCAFDEETLLTIGQTILGRHFLFLKCMQSIDHKFEHKKKMLRKFQRKSTNSPTGRANLFIVIFRKQ